MAININSRLLPSQIPSREKHPTNELVGMEKRTMMANEHRYLILVTQGDQPKLVEYVYYGRNEFKGTSIHLEIQSERKYATEFHDKKQALDVIQAFKLLNPKTTKVFHLCEIKTKVVEELVLVNN